MRRIIHVAVLAGATLLAMQAATHAQTFKAGPVRYMVSANHTVAPGAHTGVTGYCQQGTRAAAGGFAVNGPVDEVTATSSHPVDAGDADSDRDDGWYANVYNDGDTARKMKHVRICLRPALAAGQLSYRTSVWAVGAGTISSIRSEQCFGDRVLGGGVQLPGNPVNNRVDANGPYSNQGTQAVPDDGWSMRTTTSNGPANMLTFAICMPPKAVGFRYKRKQVVIHGGQTKRIVVRCPNKPGWRVVGGGVQGIFVRVKQSFPWDSKDKGKAPDDGWVVRGGVPSPFTDPVVATAHAICLKKKKK